MAQTEHVTHCLCARFMCLRCACTVFVNWRCLELPAGESDESKIGDIKGVKVSAEECRKRYNTFGISYDSCGDNGAMA